MTGDDFLRALSATCRDIVRDTVNGISVCTRYEDATLVGFMKTHQIIGLRLLMLPLAAQYGVTSFAEAVFDRYMTQLEDVKNGSRSLLQGGYDHGQSTTRPASVA